MFLTTYSRSKCNYATWKHGAKITGELGGTEGKRILINVCVGVKLSIIKIKINLKCCYLSHRTAVNLYSWFWCNHNLQANTFQLLCYSLAESTTHKIKCIAVYVSGATSTGRCNWTYLHGSVTKNIPERN
jgi:hypothetical protein